jgi:hypothetical protein
LNSLYKYCNCLGGIKILASLELKLPYISDVNDPYDCRPCYFCSEDEDKIIKRALKAFENRGMRPPNNYKEVLEIPNKKKTIQDKLIAITLDFQNEVSGKYCLLSVSRNAKNPAMWAHYAESHQGVAIGIDFDTLFYEDDKAWGIRMHEVQYPLERQRIDVLDDEEKIYLESLITKSNIWKYEEEYRSVLAPDSQNLNDTTLEELERKGLALRKDFDGKKTWFLRLNPKAIKEVVFGLYSDDSLKLTIRKLTASLPDVKLYQTNESETYEFNLIQLNR